LLRPIYQPVIDLRTRKPVYLEALARVAGNSAIGAHVPLLALAEEFGYIHVLDFSVMQSAFRRLAAGGEEHIGVNVSPLTLERADDLCNLLASHRSLAPRLVLEITESVEIRDLRSTKRLLNALRGDFGCRLALDDYGSPSGCISLRLIAELRPEYVKLDGSLLDRAMSANGLQELLRVQSLTHSMGSEIVAEWVDTARKVTFLQRHGINLVQGSLFDHIACPAS
jgi:EAL domain-containing protein (putative c-di-GMP-specific phosphodiesterase class I)